MISSTQIICLIVLSIIFVYLVISKICETIENVSKIHSIAYIAGNADINGVNELIDNLKNTEINVKTMEKGEE